MSATRFLTTHLALWSVVPRLLAQPAEEPGRAFCDAQDPGNPGCPGPRCVCAPDTLELTFDGKQGSTYEYATFVPGAPIETTVVLDTRSPVIQGWSYGVEHDADYVTLHSVRFEGTDAEREFLGGYKVLDMRDIETCRGDLQCPDPRPGNGFISAVVLSFLQPAELDIQRNSLAFAVYSLHSNPDSAGTRIAFVEHLRKRGAPPTRINLINNGSWNRPSRSVDGTLREIDANGRDFRRGDADGDGRRSVQDAIAIIYTWIGAFPPRFDCDDAFDADDDGRKSILDAIPVLLHVFQRGPDLPPPFHDCGADPTADALGCAEATCP